jgi:hypothetical protein
MKKDDADKVARAAAILVIVIGAALLFTNGGDFGRATKTTTVHEQNFGAEPTKTTTTTEGRGKSRKDTTVVEQQSGHAPDKTTTTTEDDARSFVERALGDGGLVLLQIGILLVAGFLAGAFVQRLALGKFALKVGPVEIPDIQEAASASEEAIAKLAADLAAGNKELAEQKRETKAAVDQSRVTLDLLLDLARRIGRIEERPNE